MATSIHRGRRCARARSHRGRRRPCGDNIASPGSRPRNDPAEPRRNELRAVGQCPLSRRRLASHDPPAGGDGGHAAPHHIDRQRQAERQHDLMNAWESLGVEPNAEQSRQRGRGGPQCPAAVPAQPLTRGFVPAGFKTCQESCRRPSCRRTQSTSRCDSLASTHRKLLSQQRRASGDLLAVGDAESCGSPRHTQPATRRTPG